MNTSHPLARARLALILLAPALVVVLFAVLASWIALANLDPGPGGPEAGLARIGDALTLVIVTDGDISVEAARSAIAKWGMLVPAAGLVLASIGAWVVAGRMQRTVEGARAAIVAAEEERTSRLHEVVHELRTPLAVMGTNLELALDDPGGGAHRYIDAARRAVGRMARTVDDLAGHGGLSVEQTAEPVDLGTIAETVALEHVGPGLARGVRIALLGSRPVVVDGVDPGAVRAGIGNFLSNAIRLGPKGSTVTVDWGVEGDWAWLSVTDEGPGLAPHLHARAFERGWQGAHDRDRQGGSGLGLSIARQLTEAQGGAVTLVSEEGGGATLALWLPNDVGASRDDVVAVDGIHPRSMPWARPSVLA
jgi:signal transduction histidine kinase